MMFVIGWWRLAVAIGGGMKAYKGFACVQIFRILAYYFAIHGYFEFVIYNRNIHR